MLIGRVIKLPWTIKAQALIGELFVYNCLHSYTMYEQCYTSRSEFEAMFILDSYFLTPKIHMNQGLFNSLEQAMIKPIFF